MDGTHAPAPMRGRSQPARAEIAQHPRLTVLEHPLLATQVTLLRDIRTPAPEFTRAIEEVTRFLLWAALADTATAPMPVPGHSGTPVPGHRLAERVAALAILRAGLGMLEPIRNLLPSAPLYQIGVRRDEATLQPSVYYTNLPESYAEIDHLLLLDPMLATGGSMVHTLQLLQCRNATDITAICVVVAPQGLAAVEKVAPGIRLFTATIDQGLNEIAYIVPGLGDAGDRQFGPR